ncbi:MAG: SUMF1/EgtB/PvdO family nonheme iron enzyme, partial [bacterium]
AGANDRAIEFVAATFERDLPPGAVRIEVVHPFHLPQTLQLTPQVGRDLAHHLAWTPLRGELDIRSEPPGAQVELNGESRGATPLRIAVAGGLYRVRVTSDGHQSINEKIAVTNAAPRVARDYRLSAQRNSVRVRATPTGGVLRVNGAPVEVDSDSDSTATTAATTALSLPAGRTHALRYEKPGYLAQTRTVDLRDGERRALSFDLAVELGEVIIRSDPPAEIVINGRAAGVAPQSMRLQTLAQRIALRRDGYRTVALSVTPSASAPLLIERALQTEASARLAEATPLVTAAAGVRMKFFDPRASGDGRFTMGSTVGEKHRRANEFQREVELTRPFYVAVAEITEAQFARYRSLPLTGKNHPARNLSWLDAARFCNWMSAQDGLTPAYHFAADRARLDPRADGYRLLSEAEWEWLARVAGRAAPTRFVWGDAATIPDDSGNFADESAQQSAPRYIPRYRDGFAGVAPTASFPADAAGLYDMAGNVSEWVHDAYDLRPPAPGRVEIDPFGDVGGDGHVVKGANFRSASVTELRASFRDALQHARDDVGFRVARYLSPAL